MESLVISVSLGPGCYRHIQISANATLYKLHQAILAAFQFDDDHLHAFFMDNRRWSQWDRFVAIQSNPADRLTKTYSLQRAGLVKGKKFLYLFDFGDEWIFQCKVLRELDEKTDAPKIVRCVGEAPEQYPPFDDWDEDGPEAFEETEFPRILPEGLVLADPDDVMPDEEEELWPHFDYEGFPRLYPPEVALKEFEKLPISMNVSLKIMDYCDAAARLYGVIPLRKLLEIYNRQNKPISEELFIQVTEIIRHQYRLFSILNCEALKRHPPMESPLDWEIVSEYIYESDIDTYYDFVQVQADVPYCILPKAEFLRYARPDYFPRTDQVKKMKKFLLPYLDQETDVEALLNEMQTLIAFDYPVEATLELLEEDGILWNSQQEMNAFLSLFQELNHHSRKALNRGYTPLELVRFMPLDGQISMFDDAP